jgi:hypothetical protein
MEQVCVALPILAGKTDDARAFMHELETQRKGDYDRSERNIGIPKEVWFLASIPTGDHLVAYIESENFEHAAGMFIESQDEFDLWFKRRLNDVTGLDMNNPPADLQFPELLSSYAAS